MARTISSETIAGATLTKSSERKATSILIDMEPGRPMSMRLTFSDIVTQTISEPGKDPRTEVISKTLVGEVDVTAAEMQALPCFPATYTQLKALADAKSAQQWPELSEA